MPKKQKGKGGQGGPPAKPKPAAGRNWSRAETDRQTEPEFGAGDEVGDQDDEAGDRRPRLGDHRPPNPQQRRFAEFLVSDPERCAMTAAWKAGYGGGSPDAPLPTERRARLNLASTGHKLQAKPGVAALIADLDVRATAAFLASPAGEVVREHVAAREAAEHDLEKLAAANMDVIAAIALHDPRDIVQWNQQAIEVADSKSLEYHQAILLKEVRHEDVFHKDGSTSHITTVKLADRAPYVKMLGQVLGKFSPIKHEHSGPGGAPIEHSVGVEVAPDVDLLELCASELLGVVPASVSEQERGLAPDEVIGILRGWAADPEPHVGESHELFEEAHLEESRSRYLGDDEV